MVAKKLLEVFERASKLPEDEQIQLAEKMLNMLEEFVLYRSQLGCRHEILLSINAITYQSGENTFTVDDVIKDMQKRNTRFAESTVRTHINSVMCANAPRNHAVKYDDLERVGRGLYRLKAAVSLRQILDEARRDHAEGRTEPLDPDKL